MPSLAMICLAFSMSLCSRSKSAEMAFQSLIFMSFFILSTHEVIWSHFLSLCERTTRLPSSSESESASPFMKAFVLADTAGLATGAGASSCSTSDLSESSSSDDELESLSPPVWLKKRDMAEALALDAEAWLATRALASMRGVYHLVTCGFVFLIYDLK